LILERLRQLPLDDFASLLLEMPNSKYPFLSAVLPRMADPQVQRDWTGSDGYTLLRQTLTFARLLEKNWILLKSEPLSNQRILDFGCGWGRIIRLLYYFSDPTNLYGCDPWSRSIDICKKDGIAANLALSDYLPKSLPFGQLSFDLIFAFSVFTHLSERATAVALGTLAQHLAPDGLLAITIRPVEHWDIQAGLSADDRESLKIEHAKYGFAFKPHSRAAVDGDITYGDTSISFSYLASKFPELKLRKMERTLDDPYQLVLFFSK
jgi:SAM-dependent methyltransferase